MDESIKNRITEILESEPFFSAVDVYCKSNLIIFDDVNGQDFRMVFNLKRNDFINHNLSSGEISLLFNEGIKICLLISLNETLISNFAEKISAPFRFRYDKPSLA